MIGKHDELDTKEKWRSTLLANTKQSAMQSDGENYRGLMCPSHLYDQHRKWSMSGWSSLGDGPDSIDDPRKVTTNSQNQTDPELHPAAKPEEDPKRRQEDGDDDVDAGCCTHT